jgi:hypothetical protein
MILVAANYLPLIKISNYEQHCLPLVPVPLLVPNPYLVSAVPPVCLSQVFVLRMENLFPKSETRQEFPCPLQPHPTILSSSQRHPRRERQSATRKQNYTVQ